MSQLVVESVDALIPLYTYLQIGVIRVARAVYSLTEHVLQLRPVAMEMTVHCVLTRQVEVTLSARQNPTQQRHHAQTYLST